MSKIKIIREKTSLPLSISRGTLQERLQKAREYNLRFFDNLQDKFEKREMKPSVFKRTLQETAGTKTGIEIFSSDNCEINNITPLLTQKNIVRGFCFFMPLSFFYNKIRKSDTGKFMKQTQEFFNEIFNPKFLARKVSISNKMHDLDGTQIFYLKNLEGKRVLKEPNLEAFLHNKTYEEQINLLQYLRYKIIGEQNIRRVEYDVDKRIEKAENLRFVNKNYDFSDCKYNEKLAVINRKLAQIIQKARQINDYSLWRTSL